MLAKLPAQYVIAQHVACALSEDIGAYDWTAALIDPQQHASATVLARVPAVIAGRAWFDECVRQVDPASRVVWQIEEGAYVAADTPLCTLHGQAQSLLTAERTALNFLQLLSATATETRRHVDAIAHTQACIMDTRKTLPGLRHAQKYAVLLGGGHNQRAGLYDGVLLKENHIAAAGGVRAAFNRAQNYTPAHIPLQIEVETLAQLEEALDAGATLILLDNMSLEMLRMAVALTAGRAQLEVSGGVSLANLRMIAETGVNRISIGHLTKDICAIDLSMRLN